MSTHKEARETTRGEPTELLATVTDVDGIVWTRYHTDLTGEGRHWWTATPSPTRGGWQAFGDLNLSPTEYSGANDGA